MKSTENVYEKSISFQIMYPRSCSIYTIFAAILSIYLISGPILLFIYLLLNGRLKESKDFIIILVYLIFHITASAYLLILDLKLIRKKIYFEYSAEYIKFYDMWKCTTISLKDVESIKKISRYRRPDSIIINSRLAKKNKVQFPIVWFYKEDLIAFLDFIRKYNKKHRKIIIDVGIQ